MRHFNRVTVLAATSGFLLGLFEFGFVFEGLVLSIEDILSFDTKTRILGAIIVGIASTAFALYAARSAVRTQLQMQDLSEIAESQ